MASDAIVLRSEWCVHFIVCAFSGIIRGGINSVGSGGGEGVSGWGEGVGGCVSNLADGTPRKVTYEVGVQGIRSSSIAQ